MQFCFFYVATAEKHLRCEPKPCIQNMLCIRGDIFDHNKCKCVPCPEIYCPEGESFDKLSCACVANEYPTFPPCDCPAGATECVC